MPITIKQADITVLIASARYPFTRRALGPLRSAFQTTEFVQAHGKSGFRLTNEKSTNVI
jgi:hypothetical protein